jgi:N-acylneuraminate cytidylyltransferase
LQKVGGVPLVARSIRHAKAVSEIESVWVTTDDIEIAVLACEEGARVVHRPEELATDDAPTDAALVHALGVIRASGRDPDLVVTLQPTSPFRRTHVIVECIAHRLAFSAYELHQFCWSHGYPYEEARKRRQDREPMVIEDGSIYVTPVDVLVTTGSRVTRDSTPVIHLGPVYTMEIDGPRDLVAAMALSEEYDLNTTKGPL